MELADLRRAFEVMLASEVLWRQTDRALRDEIANHQRNVRHWREECGKLHAQITKLKGDLQAWEATAKRIEEADAVKPVAWRWRFNGNWHFGERPAPQGYPSEPLYAAPSVDAKGTLDDGACVRCGAVPRNASGLCATCVDEDAVRAGEIDIEECGNHSAGSPP